MALNKTVFDCATGRYVSRGEPMSAEEESAFEAARVASRPTTIALDVFARRVRDEGLWDSLSDYMNGTATRRRLWEDMRTIRDPIPTGSVQVRNVLSAIGATEQQTERIMVPG